jgi:two-component system phosphate regulon sensor histidine kinase PhoR
VRQVLTNLLSNAIRYSPTGTSIIVSLTIKRIGELATRYSEFAAARSGDLRARLTDDLLALIAVEDQGAGVSDEQRQQLFKRYARGRERTGEGLGLGLYLSREFVVRHGGAIWVESRLGQGTTFYVALPLDLPLGDE